MSADSEKFWFNLTTGQVERGLASPMVDRAGPFDTAEEAARAPEIMRARSQKWDEDDAKDSNWGSSSDEK